MPALDLCMENNGGCSDICTIKNGKVKCSCTKGNLVAFPDKNKCVKGKYTFISKGRREGYFSDLQNVG